MKTFLLSGILLLFIFVGCSKEAEIGQKDYPYVLTYDVTDNTENSVTFNGEIIYTGREEMLECGFFWNLDTEVFYFSHSAKCNVKSEMGKFSLKTDRGFYKDKVTVVRAYILTNEHMVIGNEVRFFHN